MSQNLNNLRLVLHIFNNRMSNAAEASQANHASLPIPSVPPIDIQNLLTRHLNLSRVLAL